MQKDCVKQLLIKLSELGGGLAAHTTEGEDLQRQAQKDCAT